MKLTGAEINKAYSEQLAKLLLDGYTFVVARENGSLEKNKDEFAKIDLEKDGKRYEFGYWYESINQSTEKHTLTLTERVKSSWWNPYAEINNLLVEPYTYYSYNFRMDRMYELYKYFVFSTKEEAIELYEKRKQRAEYREWAIQRIVNTFKVAKTNYKGFKKDVIVESLRSSYMLTNKNGRKASVSKSTGRFTAYWYIGKELADAGSLLFSPKTQKNNRKTIKNDKKCWQRVYKDV